VVSSSCPAGMEAVKIFLAPASFRHSSVFSNMDRCRDWNMAVKAKCFRIDLKPATLSLNRTSTMCESLSGCIVDSWSELQSYTIDLKAQNTDTEMLEKESVYTNWLKMNCWLKNQWMFVLILFNFFCFVTVDIDDIIDMMITFHCSNLSKFCWTFTQDVTEILMHFNCSFLIIINCLRCYRRSIVYAVSFDITAASINHKLVAFVNFY